jgi:hypothetical protein
LELPESPQHRVWREARTTAGRRIDGLREQLRESLSEAIALLDGDDGTSDAYFALRLRIGAQLDGLGVAIHCAKEWSEPDDARADVDRNPKPGVSRRGIHGGG